MDEQEKKGKNDKIEVLQQMTMTRSAITLFNHNEIIE